MTQAQFNTLAEISQNIQAIISDAYAEGRISFGMYLQDSKRYADYMRDIIEGCAMRVEDADIIRYMQEKIRKIVLHDVVPYVNYENVRDYYLSIFDASVNF